MGAVPVHVPGAAVSVWPSWTVPEMVGADVFTGAVPDVPDTAAVRSEPRVVDPTVLLAVTNTRRACPTSAGPGT